MRAFIARTLLALFLIAPAAASASPATDLIRGMADQAIATLAETKGDLTAREQKLRGLLKDGFDMPFIARFVLGRYWNRATPDQQRDYVQAFSDYVVATYARRFGGYAGESLEIAGEREAGPKDKLVATRILRGDGPAIEAEWRVRVDEGSAKVTDVTVEGVSMAVTQRAEFASVVRQNGIDGLIHILQARAGRKGVRP